MSLLSVIPGLSKHKASAAPVAVPTFDQEKARRLMREAVGIVTGYYPEGAQTWLRDERPDVVAKLELAEQHVDAAVLAGDMDGLRLALDGFVTAHRRAFATFEGRPPVMPQRDLFCVG